MQLERFSENLGNFFLAHEHVHRYLWAKQLCKGLRVLDIACGEGYGSNILSNVAKEVLGVDLNQDALKLAKKKYANDNLAFFKADCTTFVEPLAFDVAVSFETIEHLSIEEQKKFLKCIGESLKEDGIFIVSTPNKKEHIETDNDFHKHELELNEFITLLKTKFSHVKLYGQRLSPVSVLSQLDATDTINCSGEVKSEFVDYSKGVTSLVQESEQNSVYFIAICSNNKIKSIERSSILFDNSFALSVAASNQSQLESRVVENKNSINSLQILLQNELLKQSNKSSGFEDSIKAIQVELMKQINRISRIENESKESFSQLQELLKKQQERSFKQIVKKFFIKFKSFIPRFF